MENIKYAIANELIEKANSSRQGLTPMKLQKLFFKIFGYYKAKTGLNIFDDEKFQVWQFGPVLQSLYSYFRPYSTQDIREFAVKFDGSIPRISRDAKQNLVLLDIIDKVWNRDGCRGAIELSEESHMAGTPWDTAKKQRKSFIDNEIIEAYFKGELQKNG